MSRLTFEELGLEQAGERVKHCRNSHQVAVLAAHLNRQVGAYGDHGHLPADRIALEQSLAACRVLRTEDLVEVRDRVVACLEVGEVGEAVATLTLAGIHTNGADIRVGAASFVTLVTKGRRTFFPHGWRPASGEDIAKAAKLLARDCATCLTLINNELDNRDPGARAALEDMGG